MTELSRRTFGLSVSGLAFSALTPGKTAAETASKAGPGGSLALVSYEITPNVETTLARTIVPAPTPATPVEIYEISRYSQYGYGNWSYGNPLPTVTRTDILVRDDNRSAFQVRDQLLHFFTISDIHITDKESPNQAIYLQRLHPELSVSGSLFSGVMLYTTHVLDAAIQTVNSMHRSRRFDFGLSLGDACNSAQYNELRWFIDVLDGKAITPSSGAHLGAGSIDYQKPYKAAGLDKSIPWYAAVGNHDHFWLGSISIKHSLRPDLAASYTGASVIAIGDVLQDPSTIKDRTYYMGVVNGETPYGEVKYAGPVGNFRTPPTVAPDPRRRPLSRSEWINEFFHTTSNPAGHGFDRASIETGFACYSFVPKSSVPLKIIVLDDTQGDDDGSVDIHGHGFLSQQRWDWLKQELSLGDAASQLMIIAAHVPIGVEPTGPRSEMGWWTDASNAVTLPGLIAELQRHPNLLAWLAGHRHLNVVKPFPAPQGAAAEHGFWQIETSSLRDFPQQLRTFDIHLNTDFTISIVTANVDPAVLEGTPAAMSRRYAVATEQILKADRNGSNPTHDPLVKPTPDGSYNAELVKQLSPAMQAHLKAYFHSPDASSAANTPG